MFDAISKVIKSISTLAISEERKVILNPLIAYIQEQLDQQKPVHLNFICTHNSRRSHLAQIWAQTMAFYFGIENIFCYSGGTEATAMFPKVVETLLNQGFQIQKLSEEKNPIYEVKYDSNEPPIICFSKTFDDDFNSKTKFVAIMTCSSADVACPYIPAAEKRFSIRYEDPKRFDGTDLMNAKYSERSMEIGSEMHYVFSQIQK